MAKYTTLDELLDSEEPEDVSAYLDNDNVSFVLVLDPDEELLTLHPNDLQEQALARFGIQAERV